MTIHPLPLTKDNIGTTDALLIIDMQNDFMPGGALPVTDGPTLIPTINQLSHWPFGITIATQDWHPQGHSSFTEQKGPWPRHCIAGSKGAALVDRLDQTAITHIIRKGTALLADSNSAFYDEMGRPTGLTPLLKGLGITRLFLCGVALDVCVYATAKHAISEGFQTYVISNASAGINPSAEFYTQAEQEKIQFVTLAPTPTLSPTA